MLAGLRRARQPRPRWICEGYADAAGAITVLHGGDPRTLTSQCRPCCWRMTTAWTMSAPAEKFVNWLVPRQKPDGTFDRFCRDAAEQLGVLQERRMPTTRCWPCGCACWRPCRTSWQQAGLAEEPCHQPGLAGASVPALARRLHGVAAGAARAVHGQPGSLVAQDTAARPAQRAEADKLARAIHATFWNPVDKRFLVSTQLEQRSQKPAFYPDHVAQIFPLLVDFPLLPADAGSTTARGCKRTAVNGSPMARPITRGACWPCWHCARTTRPRRAAGCARRRPCGIPHAGP